MSASMPDELLVSQPRAGVAVITINRPDRLNAVTMDMQRRLDALLAGLESDGQTRCVVLTGSGKRAFSAGYDVHEMADWSADELLLALLERERWLWHVASTPVPVIAALNGLTYGVGAIMASSVDIRIASTACAWRFTAGEHGGANATWTLPRLVGPSLATELLMTSRKIPADEALRIGLVSRVVAPDDLLDAALDTAEAVAANPPAGVRAIKRLVREHEGRSVEDRFVAENLAMRTELRPRPVGELYDDFLKQSTDPGPPVAR